MGLALYDASDSLAGMMTEALHDERRESRTRPPRPPRHPPKVRYTKCDCGYGGHPKIPIRECDALKDAHWLHSRPEPGNRHYSSSYFSSPPAAAQRNEMPITIPRQRPRSRIAWASYVSEGLDLQAPPAPRRQARRPPSLERQDAFRHVSTSRPQRRLSADDYFRHDSDFSAAVAAEEVADLYDMGLLYEDEHLRGPGFGFDTLVRNAEQQPQYTIYFRRAAVSNTRSRGGDKTGRSQQLRKDNPMDATIFIRRIDDDPDVHPAPSADVEELEWCLDGYDPDGSDMPDLVSDSDDDSWVGSTGWVILSDVVKDDKRSRSSPHTLP